MKQTENNRGYLILITGLLMLQVIAAFCFCVGKEGYHYDEYYSYYSSNVSAGLVPTDREWKSGDEIRNEFQVLPGEQFRFPTVVRMQSYDVHPPVYYLLLHAVCSLTPGIFSKWSGFAVNLFFFLLSYCLLAWLSWHLSGRKIAAVLGTCLLYGFNPAVLSGVMLMRMYTLLGFFILVMTFLHVRALETGKRGWTFYIPVAVTIYLGFLTHYYFAVYLFFLAAAMEFYLLFRKADRQKWGRKWKDCFLYGIIVAGALVLAVLSYPASLGHIFRGYRGTEAMGAFFDIGNTAGRIRFFSGLLNEYVFGFMLPLLLLVLILLILTIWGITRLRRSRAGNQLHAAGADEQCVLKESSGNISFLERHIAILVPAAAVAGYFAVVTKTALLTAEEANRYQIPVYGLLLLLSITLLVRLADRTARLLFTGNGGGRDCTEKRNRFIWLLTGAMSLLLVIGEFYGLYQGKVLFLYEEDTENIAFSSENHSEPVVYFYNQPLSWMIWDDSLELMQYDSIYFVNMDDVSTLRDNRLSQADRILVYAARGDRTRQALEAVTDGNPRLKSCRRIRELLYCDLYEFTAAAPETARLSQD